MSAPRVDLRIEELVLHGVRAADRERVATALRDELVRLLAGRGAAGLRPMEAARLDVGAFPLRAGAPPAELGRQAARSLYRGLTR